MGAVPSTILDATWLHGTGKTLIKYCGEDKKVRVIDAGMHPYFFIRENDLERARLFFKDRVIRVERGKFVTIDGYRAVKIVVRYPSDVHAKRRGTAAGLRVDLESNGIVTYESDIPFVRRWMIDKQVFQCDISKKAYVDIEVEARAGFPDVEEAENRILSIAVSGNDGKKFFFCDKDERKMLMQYYDVLRKHYHMVTGWNWRSFDGEYLRNRTRRLGLKPEWIPIQEIDAMINYQKLTIWGFVGKSYSLENVAKEHLGIDMQKLKMSPQQMWESFIGDHKELYKYNMMDADIVRELDSKLRICDPYIEITKLYPLLLNDAPFMSRVIDVMLLNEAIKHPWRLVFPKRVQHSAELLGGKTLRPDAGVHSGVFSLDFKSLYPSVIITFGLSPELMYLFQAWRQSRQPLGEWVRGLFGVDCDDSRVPPSEPIPIPKPRPNPSDPKRKPKPLSAEEKYAHWKREYLGQIPAYVYFSRRLQELGVVPYPFMAYELERLLALRSEIKKRMKSHPEGSIEFMAENIRQAAVKLVLVSSYGVTGYRSTRFFNAEFVNATTGLSQTVLDFTCQIADELGYRVLYGDTDSVFLKPKGGDVHPLELTMAIGEFERQCNEMLRQKLVEMFGLDSSKYVIQLNAENVYSKITLTKVKKKYIADCVWVEGKFCKKRKVTGFETKRSDAFELLSELQVKIVDILHSEDIPADQVEDAVHDLVTDMITEMFEGKHDKKLILQMTLQKGSPEDYGTTSPHVRVARKLQEMGEYRPGDKVKWIVVDTGVEEPVLDVDGELPRPRFNGYRYYAKKLLDAVERMIGSAPPLLIGDDGRVYEQTVLA